MQVVSLSFSWGITIYIDKLLRIKCTTHTRRVFIVRPETTYCPTLIRRLFIERIIVTVYLTVPHSTLNPRKFLKIWYLITRFFLMVKSFHFKNIILTLFKIFLLWKTRADPNIISNPSESFPSLKLSFQLNLFFNFLYILNFKNNSTF